MDLADASSAKSWRRETAFSCDVADVREGLSLSTFKIKPFLKPEILSGAKLLFISDLHVRTEATWSWAPFQGGLVSWRGVDWLAEALRDVADATKPDYLVFGGDLVVHSCWLERAMNALAAFPPGIPKAAVYGNWDKRRRRWLPHRVWEDLYEKAGWKLLVNASMTSGPIRFFGLDDFKMGKPSYAPPSPKERKLFNCVVSHNPDGVLQALSERDLAEVDLILCGHTHGGQWRVPGLGAFITSSRHWKAFEKGLYKHSAGRARMIVSSGVGATAFRARVNCPPELALVEFV